MLSLQINSILHFGYVYFLDMATTFFKESEKLGQRKRGGVHNLVMQKILLQFYQVMLIPMEFKSLLVLKRVLILFQNMKILPKQALKSLLLSTLFHHLFLLFHLG